VASLPLERYSQVGARTQIVRQGKRMENTQPKKGMSKGCLIGLIIVGVIVVIIIVGGVVCWVYKEDLAKMGAVTVVSQMKTQLAHDAPDGVDTTSFNALADGFIERLNEDEELNLEEYGMFMQSLQGAMQDKK